MSKRIVILGGGTAGTLTANRLRRHYSSSDASITVVDQDDVHIYQPALLFIPFGIAHTHDIVKPRHKQLAGGITYIQSRIKHVELESDTVTLANGKELAYDVLIVATGVGLTTGETEGLDDALRTDSVFTFYTLDGATALASALAKFEGGRLVVNVVDMPIKCPVAPLEFCFLADWFFTKKGIRDKVTITYATPLDGAFTKPVASERLKNLLAHKGIELVTEFNTGEVDADAKKIVSYDGREVEFDLAAIVPLHSGADYIAESPGLGDDLNFVPVDQHTLQSKAKTNVFAIGDTTNAPTSKAGSVAHFEGDILVENVTAFLDGKAIEASFDGHANCFIETGFNKALLIDFNYETEPLTGRFPAKVGLPLLKESRVNHIGKLMFEKFYWHALLPGRDIPFVAADMPLVGKNLINT